MREGNIVSGVNLTRSVGEYVVYKKHGVYVIEGIKTEKIGGAVRTYYALRSVYDEKNTVYVPADSEVLTAQMENVLTKEEIDKVIEESRSTVVEWKTPAAARSPYLEEIVKSCHLPSVISAYILLKEKKEEAIRTKSKVFAHDERMLAQCVKMIYEAFSFTLNLKKDEVLNYVLERTEKASAEVR